MEKQEERDRLEQPVADLEAFEKDISSAAEVIIDRIGQLASEGASKEDLDWLTRISDAAQNIMGPMEELFQAINDAPCDPTVDEKGPEDSLDDGESQGSSDAANEIEAFIMPEGLTEGESARLTKAFEVLSTRAQVGDKGGIHIRQVVESVFGKRTIPKEDFTKFVDDLNKVAKHRGAWYFVETTRSKEVEVPTQDDEIKDPRSVLGAEQEDDNPLVLNSRESQIWYQVLDGGSTTEWFGQADLDLVPLQFVSNSAKNTAFSKFAKKAIEAGILIDNGKTKGARRYKIASGVETVPSEQGIEKVDSLVEEPNVESEVEESQESDQTLIEGLTEREQKILECIVASAKDLEWFKQSEVDLSSIEFSSESARRQAFGKLTLRAIELGVLVDNGKARGGKKYQLVKEPTFNTDVATQSEAKPAKAKSEKAAKKTKPTIKINGGPKQPPIPFYEAQKAKPNSPSQEVTTPVELSERDKLRSERLAKAVVSFVEKAHLTEKRSGNAKPEKVSTVAKDVALRLGIEVEEARELVKNLIEGGQFYINGHSKGSPLLSTQPPEVSELDGHVLTPSEIETKKDQERQRIVELRGIYEEGILSFLSTLTKEQTEFKTAIAAALGDEVSADDVNEICNLLRTDGLLEAKREAGRGSRRTRKGKTWKITGPGRRKLNEARAELTNREKKQLGKGLSTAKQA